MTMLEGRFWLNLMCLLAVVRSNLTQNTFSFCNLSTSVSKKVSQNEDEDAAEPMEADRAFLPAEADIAVSAEKGGGGGKDVQLQKRAMVFRNVYQQPLPSNVVEVLKRRATQAKVAVDKKLIVDSLCKNFVFQDLPRNQLEPMVAAFEGPITYQRDDVIIQQGDPCGQYFYVIKSGRVEFKVNDQAVGYAEKGASFGELGLLYSVRISNARIDRSVMSCFPFYPKVHLTVRYCSSSREKCPRAATVIAGEPTALFRVHQNEFRYTVQSQAQQCEKEKLDLVANVPFLKDVSTDDIAKLSSVMTPRFFRANEVLTKKGEDGDAFYIVVSLVKKFRLKLCMHERTLCSWARLTSVSPSLVAQQKGVVLVKDISIGSTKYDDQKLGPGDYFGERSLVTGEPHVANVVGETDGVVFSVDRATFTKVLGKMSIMIMKAQDGRRLAGIPIIKSLDLNSRQIQALASHIEDQKFGSGSCILREDETTESAVYLVRKGKVKMTVGDVTCSIVAEGGFFGDSNFSGVLMIKSSITAFAMEDCICGILKTASCMGVFDIRLLSKAMARPKMKKGNLDEQNLNSRTDIELKDLEKHKIIGQGTFGQVWLVSANRPEGSKHPYALKIQSKYELAEEGQIHSVLREKSVMYQLDHPFIINARSFMCNFCLLFVLRSLKSSNIIFLFANSLLTLIRMHTLFICCCSWFKGENFLVSCTKMEMKMVFLSHSQNSMLFALQMHWHTW